MRPYILMAGIIGSGFGVLYAADSVFQATPQFSDEGAFGFLINLVLNGGMESVKTVFTLALFIIVALLAFSIYRLFQYRGIRLNIKRKFNRYREKAISRDELEAFLAEDKSLNRTPVRDWYHRALQYRAACITLSSDDMESELDEAMGPLDGPLQVLISSIIIIGLLFTFLGLTITVIKSISVLNELGVGVTPDQFVKRLMEPMSGMSLAFQSSFIGLLLSLGLSIFNAVRLKVKEAAMTRFMTLIRNQFVPFFGAVSSEDSQDRYYYDFHEKQKKLFDDFYKNHFELIELMQQNIEERLEIHNTSAANLITTATNQFKETTQFINKTVTEYIQKDFQKTDNLITDFGNKFTGAAAIYESTSKDIIEKVSSQNQVQQQGAKDILKASEAFKKHIHNFIDLQKPLDGIRDKFDEFIDKLESVFDSLEKISIKNEPELQKLENIYRVMEGLNNQVSKVTSDNLKIIEGAGLLTVEKLEEMKNVHADASDRMENSIHDFRAAIEEQLPAVKARMGEDMDKLKQDFDWKLADTINDMRSNLEQQIDGTRNGLKTEMLEKVGVLNSHLHSKVEAIENQVEEVSASIQDFHVFKNKNGKKPWYIPNWLYRRFR